MGAAGEWRRESTTAQAGAAHTYRGELVAGVADEHAGLAHRAVAHSHALDELGHAHLSQLPAPPLLLSSPAHQAEAAATASSRKEQDKESAAGTRMLASLVFSKKAKPLHSNPSQARQRHRPAASLKNSPLAGSWLCALLPLALGGVV
jgi:hypothetical protein